MSKQIVLELDKFDEVAVNRAIAHRQTFRDMQGCILPDGESNTVGAVIAEICRSWLDDRGMWEWSKTGE